MCCVDFCGGRGGGGELETTPIFLLIPYPLSQHNNKNSNGYAPTRVTILEHHDTDDDGGGDSSNHHHQQEGQGGSGGRRGPSLAAVAHSESWVVFLVCFF